MKITVCRIEEEGFMRQGEQCVRIDFSSPVICGSAHLVATKIKFWIGSELDVEIGYLRCDNFARTSLNNASVQYNDDLDFYTINAPVSMVHEDGVFWVEVSDFRVMLEPVDNLQMQAGNWLQFNLHGLELWPCNL